MKSVDAAMNELFEHPEKFRSGPNYRASNVVFPVEYKGRNFIVKRSRRVAGLMYVYYTLRDRSTGGVRQWCAGEEGLEREARILEKLDGEHAPRLYGRGKRVLVREYLKGKTFREIYELKNRERALMGGVEALEEIHQRGVVMGGAHVENLLWNGSEAYWLDFDGKFDESDVRRAMALDLMGLISSTYAESKYRELALYVARAVRERYPNGAVKDRLVTMLKEKAPRMKGASLEDYVWKVILPWWE